jgi:hypothetical protein
MNDTSVEMDFLGKTSFDAEGKGFILQTKNPPAEGLAQINMSTIATPKVPAAGMPGVKPAAQQGEQEEDEGAEEALKEHLAALFANANLSEDFVEKAKTIFVAAVNEKSNEIATRINEAYKAEYTNALASTVNELTEKVDDYLTYVVEEWVNENKLQVERGIKVELAENFIFGLKKLFESNFIDVPNEKYDVLDELYSKIEEQEDALNTSMNENIALRKKLLESAAVTVFAQETQGLAQTQIEKLANLAEGIEFDDAEQFRGKIQILKESYFGNGNSQPQSAPVSMPRFSQKVDILDTASEPELISEGMDIYKKAISRHLKK